MSIIHISWVGPVYEVTDHRGKVWRFTYHPYFGPDVVRKDGTPFKRQPSAKSPFWAALKTWVMPAQLRERMIHMESLLVGAHGS